MVLQVFIIGLIASFIGSIPPGTLNILVLQMGLENKIKTAMRFILAVAIIEYPYAWIAVEFEDLITSSPMVKQNFKLLAAVVMLALGILGLWSARKPSALTVKFQESGFRKGLILSILNPQAIPWWIGVTAYLKVQGWIVLDTPWRLHSYVLGTSVGVLLLLVLLAFMAQKLSRIIKHNRLVALLPGLILTLLGLVALYSYFTTEV
ncbi:MAG TPA: LysE family transporter [Cyclobacteriaceae bacterium]|nr:LysE family transporter [Cytophagales bacterium]HNT51026.1 LysE family transporter [Cyclobacteriaceae bacterium]HRE68211.1 LysE family transporter [Cyclobacteriaceae bacterium]HRF33635.1 LysE family transporter [Cyclobacteriaceae bacterium]